MTRSQEDRSQGPFTEAFRLLYGFAGNPPAKRLETRTQVSATTIEGWLKEGRTPRNETVAMDVVRKLRGSPNVPAEMRSDEFWLARLRQQKALGPPSSTQGKRPAARGGPATATSDPVAAAEPVAPGEPDGPAAAPEGTLPGADPARHRPRRSRSKVIAAVTVLGVLITGGAVGAYHFSGASDEDGKGLSSTADSPVDKDTTVPLRFVADAASWQCGDAVVIPRTVGAAGLAPGPRPANGVSASKTGLGFTVQGVEGQTVVLLGLAVEVVSKEEPLRGSRVPVVCQGDPPNRNLAVDLDQQNPQVVKAASRAGDGGSRSDTGWPYTVSGSDPEHFVVQPSTRTHDVTFTLLLKWAWNGKRGSCASTTKGSPSGRPPTATRSRCARTAP